MDPNPKLLAFFEKMAKPVEKCQIGVELHGVYSFPEQWIGIDEANPYFSYKVHFLGIEILDGKIIPRQPTEKELREIEEAQAAKNKKGGKDKKQQEVQKTPEELEEEKRRAEEEEEQAKKAQEEWNQLDEQTKFYRTYEDKHKQPQIKIENNYGEIEFEGEQLLKFEDKVYETGGEWIEFIKYPKVTEEELVKMKKGKPKGITIQDLNPLVARGWVDFKDLQNPGCDEIIVRCKLQQTLVGDANIDPPEIDFGNCYIKYKLNLSPAITPAARDIIPTMEDIIPKQPTIPKVDTTKQVVVEFKSELTLAIESISMEYASLFGKELNNQQDKARGGFVPQTAQQKKESRDVRKEKFLYDFNTQGKYHILKERLKKSIMKLVRDKFQKQGSLTGVTTDNRDQFYSELYVYMMEQMRQTLKEVIETKRDELHEDIVQSYEYAEQERQAIVANITKETPVETTLRIAKESEILNCVSITDKNLKNLIDLNRQDPKNWFEYCKFQLKLKNYGKAEESLAEALSYDKENENYQVLMSCFLLNRGRVKEAIVYLRYILEKNKFNMLGNNIISFVYNKYMGDAKVARKYHAVAQRLYMRKKGYLPPKPGQTLSKTQTSISQGDNQSKSFSGTLSNDEIDEIWLEMIDYLAEQNFHELCDKAFELVLNKQFNPAYKVLAKVEKAKNNYSEALTYLDKVLETQPKNFSILSQKGYICFLLDKYYECEESYLRALKAKDSKDMFEILLRLGNVFLQRKSWGDAKSVFAQACQRMNNSSYAWLGLGIASLRRKEYKDSEEALNQANIYNPFNADVWGYLTLMCLHDGKRIIQAHQNLREMFKLEIKNLELLEEIGDELVKAAHSDQAEQCYKKIIDKIINDDINTIVSIGEIYLKTAKICHSAERISEAKEYYEAAFKNIEGEGNKEKIKTILDSLEIS